MSTTVIYYYIKGNEAIFIERDDDSNTLYSIPLKDMMNDNSYHYFRIFATYTANRVGLIKFKADMSMYVKEIAKIRHKTKDGKYYAIKYESYFSHGIATYNHFVRCTDKVLLDSFQNITRDEVLIFEKCQLAGLVTVNRDILDTKITGYGYDYSAYYPNMLTRCKFPSNAGVKKYYENVNWGKLEYGIYRVHIHTNNQMFGNIFNFNYDDHYCSSMLNYLYTNLRKKYGLTFTLLEVNDLYDYNCLFYGYDKLIDGEKLFGNWMKTINTLKLNTEKNILVKSLSSTLWGTLTQFKYKYVREEDLENYDISYRNSDENTQYKIMNEEAEFYKIIDVDNAYKYNIARIKPFLISQCRLFILKMLEQNNISSSVLRIHTDGLIFDKPVNIKSKDNYIPIEEAKTTGDIIIKSKMLIKHYCKKCEYIDSYKNFICHSC
jgi:hypothetical protein